MSTGDQLEDSEPTHCVRFRGHCEAYFPGHNMHFIHGNYIGRTPWGWRDGVITSIGQDGWISVAYALEEGTVRVYHHEDLTGELEVNEPVRVHEEYHALAAGDSWFNVAVHGGLGAVPAPVAPETWSQETTVGVVHLATGRGLALDRPFDGDNDDDNDNDDNDDNHNDGDGEGEGEGEGVTTDRNT